MTHPLTLLLDKLDDIIDSDLETAMDDLYRGKAEGYDDAPDDILSVWTAQDELRSMLEDLPNTPPENLASVIAKLWAATAAIEYGRNNR